MITTIHFNIHHCIFYSFLKNFIYLFTAALGFHCHTKAFSSSGVWASHCSGFSSPLCSGRAQTPGCVGFSSYGTQAQWLLCMGFSVSRFQQLLLSSTGLVALQWVKFAQTRDRTHVPMGRRILNHWTTREVHNFFLLRRTFEVYSLSNLQLYNIINYSHHAILHIFLFYTFTLDVA